MIIDSHTHLMLTKWVDRTALTARDLVSELTNKGIDKAVISSADALYDNWGHVHKDCNNKLAKLQKEFPGIIYGFCTVRPQDGKEAVKELKRCIEDLGLKGLKLHPWLQSFSITNPLLFLVIEEAIRLEIPIMFHDGTPPYSTPLQICNLADLYPELVIILGHSGLKDLWKNALDGAKRHKNIYLCTCACPYLAIETMIKTVGAERVLYGSDAGFGNPALISYNLDKIYQISSSEEDKRKILGENIARILGVY